VYLTGPTTRTIPEILNRLAPDRLRLAPRLAGVIDPVRNISGEAFIEAQYRPPID
jgi:hypothetical protein